MRKQLVSNERLAVERRRRGLSQTRAADMLTELAAERGYTQSPISARTVRRWEQGVVPQPHNIVLLCDLYELAPTDLNLPPVPIPPRPSRSSPHKPDDYDETANAAIIDSKSTPRAATRVSSTPRRLAEDLAEEKEPTRHPNRKLRRQRRLRGLSIDEVASELCKLAGSLQQPEPGVNGNMVSRWERGVRRPRPRYVRLLCKLFDLPADELGFVEEEVGQAAAVLDGQLDDRYYQLLVCELLGTSAETIAPREDGTSEPVKRRDFLTYSATLVGDTTLDLEALAAILNRLHKVDALRLSNLRVLTTKLEQGYDTTPPRILLPAVRGNLARLRYIFGEPVIC